jgi:hypothetical protein
MPSIFWSADILTDKASNVPVTFDVVTFAGFGVSHTAASMTFDVIPLGGLSACVCSAVTLHVVTLTEHVVVRALELSVGQLALVHDGSSLVGVMLSPRASRLTTSHTVGSLTLRPLSWRCGLSMG